MPRLLLLKHNIITHHAQFSVFDVVCQSTINACQADTESDQWRIQGWSSDTALILLVALEGDSFNMFFWNELHVAIDPPPRGVELEHSAAVTGTRNCLAVFMYIPMNYRTEWERCASLIINMCTVCHTTGSLFSSQTCLIEIKNYIVQCLRSEMYGGHLDGKRFREREWVVYMKFYIHFWVNGLIS